MCVCVFNVQKENLLFQKERAALISILISEFPIFTKKGLWRNFKMLRKNTKQLRRYKLMLRPRDSLFHFSGQKQFDAEQVYPVSPELT